MLPQAALFEEAPTLSGGAAIRLLDSPRGRLEYRPGFIDAAQARAWFERLRDEIPWAAQRRPMYDRVVDVPRLLAAFRLDDPCLHPVLHEAGAMLRSAVGTPFNAVGMNYSRDGRDSVAPHTDKLHEIAADHPIALLSLGSPRRMNIREKAQPLQATAGSAPSPVDPRRRTLRIELAPGSLLLMDYATQLHYDHGIPKVRTPVGPRISLVFRVRPAGHVDRGHYAGTRG
ncbi:MAG TPA: alpha-ketoglutarate-dependent dioxygenase AlkB [Xanthomonadaceae bacterium]|nr:alpha-ketoglutarate-dependent dioxygenase AlkB [Xanthomonadaceae bacterium]